MPTLISQACSQACSCSWTLLATVVKPTCAPLAIFFFFSFFFFSYLTIKYPWGDKQRRTLMHNAVVHYTQVHHCFCCMCGLVQGLGMHLVEVLLWPGAHLSCYAECLQVEEVLEQPQLPVEDILSLQWGCCVALWHGAEHSLIFLYHFVACRPTFFTAVSGTGEKWRVWHVIAEIVKQKEMLIITWTKNEIIDFFGLKKKG